MTDERDRKKPPPLRRVTESDAPDTEPVPVAAFIPPPPPPVREPFKLLHGREGRPARLWTTGELGAAVEELGEQVDKVLSTQRQMARQTDGLILSLNSRFDVLHQELALLRHTVTEDHAPRLDNVEVVVEDALPLSARAKRIAVHGSKFAGLTLLGGAISEFWHQYGALILELLRGQP